MIINYYPTEYKLFPVKGRDRIFLELECQHLYSTIELIDRWTFNPRLGDIEEWQDEVEICDCGAYKIGNYWENN